MNEVWICTRKLITVALIRLVCAFVVRFHASRLYYVLINLYFLFKKKNKNANTIRKWHTIGSYPTCDTKWKVYVNMATHILLKYRILHSAKFLIGHLTFLGHELLKVLLPTSENFVDYIFLKAWHLTSFLQHVGHLAVGAFWCYSVLNTLPLMFLKNKNIKSKTVKMVLDYSN